MGGRVLRSGIPTMLAYGMKLISLQILYIKVIDVFLLLEAPVTYFFFLFKYSFTIQNV